MPKSASSIAIFRSNIIRCRAALRLVSAALASLALLACGGRAPAPIGPPSTAEDPAAYRPSPERSEHAPGPTAIAFEGDAGEVHVIALRFLQAVAERDETALRSLLADMLARISPQLTPRSFNRDVVLRRLLQAGTRATSPAPTVPPVTPDRMQSQPLHRYHAGPLPPGFLPNDVVVSFPLEPESIRRLQNLGWSARGILVIRRRVGVLAL